MPANLESSAVAIGLKKVSFHSNSKERQCQRMFKLLHNCAHLTHQQSNAQNSPTRLQQYMKHELLGVQAGIRKGRETRDQIANIRWIIEKESSSKTSTPALLTIPMPLTLWVTTNCGKFFKRWEYKTT